MSPHGESRVGSTVQDAWRIDALLGVGGMAAVYAATHVSGRRAAFKILHEAHRDNREVRERFMEEYHLAQLIDHPDRVEVLGSASTDDGLPLLVMELLEGETLAARWKAMGRIPARLATTIAIALLDQVAACHDRDIIHRDLKPANVFLGSDGRVRLLDFGTARGRSITRRRLAIGTPDCMPPEQARGDRNRVDARSDIFAVGALLWSILSGLPLRRARTDEELLRLAAAEPIRSLGLVHPELPDSFVAVVDRALRLDPRERWGTAREMQRALVAELALLPEDSFPPPRSSTERITIPCTPMSLRAVDTVHSRK